MANVYNGQVESSLVSQMHAFAVAKRAFNGRRTYYGVIDGDDLARIAAGYPNEFGRQETRRQTRDLCSCVTEQHALCRAAP
jgi:hypothetical protein